MNNQFLFLDYETKNIEGKDFIVIYILEYYKKQVFRIFKLQQKDLLQKLETFNHFDNINDFITFVIKRDGKISLDIKL